MKINKEKQEQFIYSAQNGDFQTVKNLLKDIDFININEKDIYGRTVLQYTVKYFIHEDNTSKEEKLNIIKFLIENGADIYSQDECGETALSYAIKYDHFDVVKLLFEFKAYLGLKDYNGFSPLETALAFTDPNSRIGFFIRKNESEYQNSLNEFLESNDKSSPSRS